MWPGKENPYYRWGICDWKKDDPLVRHDLPHMCLADHPHICMFCGEKEELPDDK